MLNKNTWGVKGAYKYPIGRPVRATITLYPIGRPVRATITLYPIGRPVRATITLYPIGRPVSYSPLYRLISTLIIGIIGLNKFVLENSTTQAQEVRHLILLLLQ